MVITPGCEWPPDSWRIDNYRRYEQLYDGDHRAAFIEKIAARIYMGDDLTNLVLNYPRTIVNIPADLLVVAPPVISFGDAQYDEPWQQVQQDSQFDTTLLEAVQDSRKLGDAVFTARRTSANTVIIETKPAYCYFPDLDPDNVRVAVGECLAWKRAMGDRQIVRVDRYEPGRVVREAYGVEGVKVGARLTGATLTQALGGAAEVELTGVADMPTLVHLPNSRSSNDYFGRSELGGGMETLFEQVDMRLSQIATVCDKHADPKMAGPRLAAGPDGVVNLRLANYFEVGPGVAPPTYITWDAQMIAAFQELAAVVDEILKHAQISPLLVGYVNGASYDSARAFRLQMAATLLMMARSGLYLNYATCSIVRVAVAMRLRCPVAEVPVPHIRWRDGLPKDMSELATTNAIRIASGTLSRLAAIMSEMDCDEATAQNELDRIAAENKALQVAAPAEITMTADDMPGQGNNMPVPAMPPVSGEVA